MKYKRHGNQLIGIVWLRALNPMSSLQQTLGQQQQITMLQNETDKLRSDNVKLYEKVRYLQSAGYSHKVGYHRIYQCLTSLFSLILQ